MAKYFVLSLIAAVLMIAQVSESKPAYQVLENRPGFVPVYIRFGDQPLEEINPSLAEAFSAHEISARNIRNNLAPKEEQGVSNFDLSFGVSKTFADAAKKIGEVVGEIPQIVQEVVTGDSPSTDDKKKA